MCSTGGLKGVGFPSTSRKDNGRALQEVLYEAAPRYIKALKREKAKPAS